MNTFALKGNIIYSKTPTSLMECKESYLICEDGRSAGVFSVLPEQYQGIEVKDFGDRIIIPGLVDLHMHAPQYAFRGLGMDLELLDWLNTHTFPEESKYMELDYARRAYEILADDLREGATTRACIFATIHVPATSLLMELLEQTGIKAYVGKVNMNRNSPDNLCENNALESIEATKHWLEESKGRYQNIQPILTPRFIPSCTDELMEQLGILQRETGLPVQSHLSENYGEIEWVKELCPWSEFYGEAYDHFGLFGKNCRTIMAHCVHSSEEEIALMKQNGVFIAHCPTSNTNLSSGVAPVRTYLEQGLKTGLGSDIAGGESVSIFKVMAHAIQASKLRWRLLDDSQKPLTIEEAFYLGTKGGGEFFGKVGSFEEGYELDAVILDDSNLRHPQPLSPKERLERMIYLSDERNVFEKYVSGVRTSKK